MPVEIREMVIKASVNVGLEEGDRKRGLCKKTKKRKRTERLDQQTMLDEVAKMMEEADADIGG